jgi:hypothetical protein
MTSHLEPWNQAKRENEKSWCLHTPTLQRDTREETKQSEKQNKSNHGPE